MSSRYEVLIKALLNGETVNFEPRSRTEKYLKNCCDKCGCDGLPKPRTRAEALLYQLAEKLAGESGGDVVLPCIIELFDQDYCGPFNVTYKAYENGSIVDRTAVVPTGDTINIVTIQGTEMFVNGTFSDVGFYDADGTLIESTSRFADGGGIYYTIPAFMNCNATIFG